MRLRATRCAAASGRKEEGEAKKKALREHGAHGERGKSQTAKRPRAEQSAEEPKAQSRPMPALHSTSRRGTNEGPTRQGKDSERAISTRKLTFPPRIASTRLQKKNKARRRSSRERERRRKRKQESRQQGWDGPPEQELQFSCWITLLKEKLSTSMEQAESGGNVKQPSGLQRNKAPKNQNDNGTKCQRQAPG